MTRVVMTGEASPEMSREKVAPEIVPEIAATVVPVLEARNVSGSLGHLTRTPTRIARRLKG
jgi:hypothetical protein